ncbi:L,D-transpeptidase family protein [Alicyclobacillus sp. SP_1]|uniref:L,D-transpeptidase family protein n=1 Tax=Alicyclobacillus sp. SP_1 TaxID=2942475 RepID=UPI0021588345|nr:L,D-transpeptidase family protein [Alicyclobacillus sp. SP_1]
MKTKPTLTTVCTCLCVSWLFLASGRNVEATSTSRVPSRPSVSIVIDTKTKTLNLYVHHRLFHTYPVALGKDTTPTPVGNWIIIQRGRDWGSGFGTRWLGLNVPWGIYGIHGTNRPTSIGHLASGGCIRMHNSDVEEVYERVRIGTPVSILGDPLYPLRSLEDGHVGADVRLVQDRLWRLGFYHGPLHGRYDEATIAAVKAFEQKLGLPVDGVVSERDYRALGLIE